MKEDIGARGARRCDESGLIGEFSVSLLGEAFWKPRHRSSITTMDIKAMDNIGDSNRKLEQMNRRIDHLEKRARQLREKRKEANSELERMEQRSRVGERHYRAHNESGEFQGGNRVDQARRDALARRDDAEAQINKVRAELHRARSERQNLRDQEH